MTSMSCSAASGCSLPAGKASGSFSARATAAPSSATNGRGRERERREASARLHCGAPAGMAPPATLSMAASMGMRTTPLVLSTQP